MAGDTNPDAGGFIGANDVSRAGLAPPRGVGFVIASSISFAVGGAFMKASDGFVRLWPSVMVVATFAVGSFLLARAVHTGGLATAYTFGLGVEAILAVVVGMCWFGEHLTPAKLIGIALIVIGVAGVRLG